MNFQALKWMIDSVVEWYSCPNCKTWVSEENIDIVWIAGTNVNLEVMCPKCRSAMVVKGQVFTMDLSSIKLNEKNIKELKDKMWDSGWKIPDIDLLLWWKINKASSIKDKEISDLSKTLKSDDISMSDLFWNEEIVSDKKEK